MFNLKKIAMKKLFFVLSFLFVLLGFSQTNTNVIRLMPTLGQGYLVLNKTSNPQVNHWETTIIRRMYNPNGSFTDKVVLKTVLANDKNYQKIPVEYMNNGGTDKYLIKIDGIGNNGQVAVTQDPIYITGDGYPIEGPPGGGGATQLCDVDCNGSTYAFNLTQYVLSGGDYILQLGTAYDYFDQAKQIGIPYYEYMSEYDFFTIKCPQHYFKWLGLVPECDRDQINIIGPLNGNNKEYRNSDGYRIYGNVYGARKGLAQWTDYQGISTTPQKPFLQTGADDPCSPGFGWDITNAIRTFNLYAKWGTKTPLPLYCDGISSSDGDGGDGGGGGDGEFCPQVYTAAPEDMVDVIEGCFLGLSAGSGNTVDRVIITNLNDFSIQPIIVDADAVDGKVHLPNLNPSLYSLGISYGKGSKGKYLPVVVEIKEKVTHVIKDRLRDFLEVSILPVPIVGNSFNAKLKADAALKFTYQIIDLYGNELHNEKITMQKGEDITKYIQLDAASGSTIIAHKFIFADGSVKSILTNRE